jgi:hypothetical protein
MYISGHNRHVFASHAVIAKLFRIWENVQWNSHYEYSVKMATRGTIYDLINELREAELRSLEHWL